ncbi:O-antigen ligase family protein [Thalassospira mesophila]|uniref:O-antigen ligase-related domain-containing protein n=1 Tax=Thalassospira mesophila TaxID=1293891 RepID=A0A1Y2L2P0_9PROT|nr:O-antigen ligase family protein [Thalassospira mesophila]OSQ39758.1 hypothetical protein TMES_07350 [Thalassospira mesophila]
MTTALTRRVLIFELIIAPLLLGGARPWAMALLALLVAIALVGQIIHQRKSPECGFSNAMRGICLAGGIACVWLALQTLPIWPSSLTLPFQTTSLALAPARTPDAVLYGMWLGAIVMLGATQNDLKNQLAVICRALVASAVLQAAIAFVLFAIDAPGTLWFVKTAHINDFTGTFANRNAFCALMAAGFFACLYLWQRPTGTLRDKLDRHGGWLALAILLFLSALASHSRAGILALIMGSLIFIWLAIPGRNRAKTLALLATVIVMTGAVFATPALTARFAQLARRDWLQRDDVWQSAITAIMHRPLTGYGPDGIAAALQYFASPGLNTQARWASSHNLWLDGLLVLGVPVFLLISGLVGYVLISALRDLAEQAKTRPQFALVMAVLTAFLVQSLFDGIATMPAVILPVAIMVGLVIHPYQTAHAPASSPQPATSRPAA